MYFIYEKTDIYSSNKHPNQTPKLKYLVKKRGLSVLKADGNANTIACFSSFEN